MPATREDIEKMAENSGFTDVMGTPYEYAAAAIFEAEKNGYTHGKDSETTFKPGEPASRAEIAQRLWHMCQDPETDYKCDYADVGSAEGKWYGTAMNYCAEQGVMVGKKEPDGTVGFEPDATMTRAEFITALQRCYENMLPESEQNIIPGNINSFQDHEDVPEWLEGPAEWAVGAGILQGKADGTLGLDEPISRADMFVMVDRFEDQFPGVSKGAEYGLLTSNTREDTVEMLAQKDSVPTLSIGQAVSDGAVYMAEKTQGEKPKAQTVSHEAAEVTVERDDSFLPDFL